MNIHNMKIICHKYAKNMHTKQKICQRHANKYAIICNKYPKQICTLSKRYAKDMQKTCKNMQKYTQYAKHAQYAKKYAKIFKGPNQYALSICRICKKICQKNVEYAVYANHATNMQNIMMYRGLSCWSRVRRAISS